MTNKHTTKSRTTPTPEEQAAAFKTEKLNRESHNQEEINFTYLTPENLDQFPPSKVPSKAFAYHLVVNDSQVDEISELLAGRCFHDIRPFEFKKPKKKITEEDTSAEKLWEVLLHKPDYVLIQKLKACSYNFQIRDVRKVSIRMEE